MKSDRVSARMIWLLRRMAGRNGHILAWDADTIDAFLKEFPEAEKGTIWYTLGAHSVPMINAAAKRAKDFGYITPGSLGNQYAKTYMQRTWSRAWRLTDLGRARIKNLG